MASTSVATLVQTVRRLVGDWPDQDTLSASLSSSSTTVTVADTSLYRKNMDIEVDSELMIVRSVTNATTLSVARGAKGSTAAAHTSGTDVLLKPSWSSVQIVDGLNAGIQASYPWVYQEVMDTSTTIAASTYEYAVPYMPGTYGGAQIFMPRVFAIDIVDPGGGLPYVPLSGWNIRRDITAPVIKLSYLENVGATLRVRGYGPFPDVALGGTLHAAWPPNLVQALPEYCASVLLMTGEARRLRTDSGLLDSREAAQRPGSSLQAATAFEARWQRRLANAGMPPPKGRITVQA